MDGHADEGRKDDILSEVDAPAAPLIEQEEEGEERKKARRGVAQTALVERLSGNEFTTFERLDFLWRTHNYISSNIRLADTKAAVTIVVSTSLIGSIYAAGLSEPLVTSSPLEWWPRSWVVASSLGMLASAILLAGWSLHPRLWWKDKIDYIFWENILRHGSPDQFWISFRKETPDGLQQGLSSNIFTLASLCRAKYRWLLYATWLAIIGGGAGAILLFTRTR